MPFELPELPFAKDALVPIMSVETLEYHYGRHHRGYVDKLNQLTQGSEFENQSLEAIIQTSSGPIFNNAAQVWNHTFFWNCLKPVSHSRANSTAQIPTELESELQKQFGSREKFQAEFTSAALNQFGSGWAWLVKTQANALAVRATSNAENPLRSGETPLLTCDVWEHAYYLDYRNDRSRFVQSFWKIVNWDFVFENFRAAQARAA